MKRICRYAFNDSKSDYDQIETTSELNVWEEIQKVYTPKTR